MTPTETQPKSLPVRISFLSFLRLILVILGLLVLWALRDIVLLIFLAMILSAAISPWIRGLQRLRIPRPVGVLIVYLAILTLIGVSISLLIPAISHELAAIPDRFPQYTEYYEKIRSFFFAHETASSAATSGIKSALPFLSQGVFAGIRGLLGGVGSFVLAMVMTYYFTVDEENVRRFWVRLAPGRMRAPIERSLTTIGERIGHWFRGQLLISGALAALTFILLLALGVPDAGLLAIIAGLASFVPIVGAAIGIVPAVFIALTLSVTKAVIVLIVTLAVYQVIANVLVPRVMAKAVGLNPVVVILVMLLGAELAGGLGLILAVPVASIIDVLVNEFGRRGSQEAQT